MTMRSKMSSVLCAGSIFALCWAVPPAADAQQTSAAAAATHDDAARDPEYHERAFREEDYRNPRFLDARHDHDHYYPPVGSVFGALPQRYQTVPDPDGDLYFSDGVWYREDSRGRYVVVAPDIGIAAPALPPHYTTVMIDGVPYYYANNTYYLASPSGYLVVDPAERR